MPIKKQKLIIIDSNALIHRAFHALPPLTNKKGELINAVYGFTMILIKVIKDIGPDYIVATFDRKEKTFRHTEYKDYKATRVKQPDELYAQIPIVKQVLEAFDIPIFEKSGYEADDLIGTITHLKSVDNPQIESIIVTGDQDALQLVDDNTKILSPHKGMGETIFYDEIGVKEKYEGLIPNQLIDYKALRGDPSDNIPGVKGIGHKGAINLLSEFKTLDEIYKNINSKKIKDRTRELLIEYKTNAFLSQKLATIIINVEIDFDLKKCEFSSLNKNKIAKLFQELNFKRLMGQLATLKSNKIQVIGGQTGLFDEQENPDVKSVSRHSPKAKLGQNYQLVDNNAKIKKFISELKQQLEFCFDTETTSVDAFSAKLLGISFCWQKNEAFYLPTNAIGSSKKDIEQIFADETVKKIGHNLKYDIEVLENYFNENKMGSRSDFKKLKRDDIFLVKGGYFDTMIASYILNPGHRQHSLDNLAFVELGYEMQPIEELIGSGRDQITMAEVPTEKVSWYSGEDADITWQLYNILDAELKKQGMHGLFAQIDMPLVEILGRVETAGVKIDKKFLDALSVELDAKIEKLETKIYKLAGQEFNVASPLQLKEILFDKMKISTAGLGKIKTGVSTAAGQLDKLKGEHKIIDFILEFRELSKLKNTYSDALPKLINTKDGRVHTSFNQTVTATGRLSSSNPNLQNIPIRTTIGQEIRKAFIAEPGFKILKADYSQIELRIAASLANDKAMLKAFDNKEDIHTQTAAVIRGIKADEVTPDLRRQAKEVNFGVLYGMGAWGLAQRTGLAREEASKFIEKYFATYKDLKKYIDETIKVARDKGYVETFYGRRRYLPEINSGIQLVRAGAERMATNMPIQGTAADILKLAMIDIDHKLPEISSKSKMILQVHDELVFEVPKADIEKVATFVREAMNKVYKLRAPIETEICVGDNWGETENLKI